MSIEDQATAGLKWTALSKAVAQVFAWAVTLVVMRILSPADYGLMAMLTVVLTFAANAAELGLGASIVQARSLPHAQLRHVAGVVLVLNVTIGAATAAAAPLLARGFAEPRLVPLIQVLALQFLFSAFSTVPQAMLARELRFKRSAAVDLAVAVSTAVTTLALALAGRGIWALVLGTLAGAAVRMLLLLTCVPRVWPRLNLRAARDHLRYGGLVTFARIGWDVVLQTDVVIAARHLSQSAIGAYSVGLHLATLPMQKLMSVVNQVAFAAVSRLQDEPQRLRAGLMKAFRMATLASVPVMWGLAGCAPELVHIVLGPKWEAAILPVQVMSLVVPLRIVSGLMWTAISAIGRVDLYIRLLAISAVVFPASFYAGVQFGLLGLAIAWPLAWMANFVIGLPAVARTLELPLGGLARMAASPVAAGVLMAVVMFGLRMVTPALGDVARLLLLVVAGAAVYVVALVAIDRPALAELRSLVARRG